MPRRKPVSSKQRKAELQLKRAIKRGDAPAPAPQTKQSARKKNLKGARQGNSEGTRPSDPSSRRLQSAFLKVDPEYLEQSRLIAASEPLPRPIAADAAVLNLKDVELEDVGVGDRQLACPKRPKWRYEMGKKEVEKNEDGMFQKWINEVDGYIADWRGTGPRHGDLKPSSGSGDPRPDANSGKEEEQQISWTGSRPPTFFERNLEVWRQFWRVSEISQILLLLLDSRCPALHFPPSFRHYLSSLRPARPLILVLTKTDLVSASHVAAWSAWLLSRYPHVRVVKVKSYREPDESQERRGQGKRKKFEPEIQQNDLDELVQALKAAHAELLVPPARVQNDPEKLKEWKPAVRQAVDWDAALRGGKEHVAVDTGEEYITIGLIGQPNVGKSSLLNAIFGAHRVKASRTPGKTKHFQTLFWTPEIRLVDCPGLVLPNFVRMELQVLCGILPISQIPSIPACAHFALRLLPLERILKLSHPSRTSVVPEDKRTWRGEKPSLPHTDTTPPAWTAMDVLVAYATNKGWVTAKAGRPDANRAGNSLLRALAEGRIHWAFWPPNTPLPDDSNSYSGGNGIWLGDFTEHDASEGDDSDSEMSSDENTDEDASQEEGESLSDPGVPEQEMFDMIGGVGRFGALALEEATEISDDSAGDP